MQSSPNFRDGKFQNRIPSQLNTTDTSSSQTMSNSFFQRVDELRPSNKIPAIKTDLNQLNREVDLLIWFGHSSFLIQVNGIRFLIDPVFIRGSPIFFVNRAFAGTNLYKPADIPEIDYLLITHDHWDHLDYNTVITLKDRIKKVICGLGVGEHFEYWGFAEDTIVELDWNDEIALKKNIVVHALPARHFSGRALKSDMTLWVSFMIESSYLNIFISGDTGYDIHFMEIKKQFSKIDLAIMENGQYNNAWKYIHLLPDELVKTIKELNPERTLTMHNSKYALSRHSWKAPLENISNAAEQYSFNLITPMIGEIVYLNDTSQPFIKWWENEAVK